MPRFYFHVFNDLTVQDQEGQELADLETVRQQAVRECRVLAAESVREGHLNLAHRIEVRDSGDRPVVTVTFGEAVEIQRG